MDLRFIRMTTGEDLITQVVKKDTHYILIKPLKIQYMVSESGNIGVSLYEWVFHNISEQQEFPIFPSDVITIGAPSDRMVKYYWDIINNPNVVPAPVEDEEEVPMNEFLTTEEPVEEDGSQEVLRDPKRVLH